MEDIDETEQVPEIYILESEKSDPEFIKNVKTALAATIVDYNADALALPKTIDMLQHKIPYVDNQHIIKNSWHSGQLKLLLGAVNFINIAYTDEIKYVVYAGAAPGIASGMLLDLFPKLKFILIDPAKFHVKTAKQNILNVGVGKVHEIIKSKKRMIIINDYMTMNLAEALIKVGICGKQLLFISDIRTDSVGESLPDCVDILWNLSQQYNWICKMTPSASMCKFRHPFYEDADKFMDMCILEPYAADFAISAANGIDFIENFKKRELVYIDGEVHLQSWAPISSTETRLISIFNNSPNIKSIKNYGTPNDYDAYMCYYNSILRSRFKFDNFYARASVGFDLCVECALEANIWESYVIKFLGVEPSAKFLIRERVWELIANASKIVNKERLNDVHGDLV